VNKRGNKVQRFFDSQIEMENIYKRIEFYKNRLIVVYCPYERLYYENLILSEIEKLMLTKHRFIERKRESEKEFTLPELSKYDGTGGHPAYVAINGIVYDVSLNSSWAGGTHFGLYSGKDLTTQYNSCHGMTQILNKLPKVGIIKK